jgi:hypothetical protein
MSRLLCPVLALCLLAAPIAAQEEERGRDLMQEGAQLLLRGLLSEVEPALDELESMMREMEPMMRGFMTEMGPALRDLLTEVEDWSLYHPPEMMPNGDIIIRRKQPRVPEPVPETETLPEGDSIDL